MSYTEDEVTIDGEKFICTRKDIVRLVAMVKRLKGELDLEKQRKEHFYKKWLNLEKGMTPILRELNNLKREKEERNGKVNATRSRKRNTGDKRTV